MENVKILEHPLLQHKISRLRDETTGTNEFRALVEEIAMLMGYEALNDLPTENVEVKTPIETCKTPMLSGRKLASSSYITCGTWNGRGYNSISANSKNRSYRSVQK